MLSAFKTRSSFGTFATSYPSLMLAKGAAYHDSWVTVLGMKAPIVMIKWLVDYKLKVL